MFYDGFASMKPAPSVSPVFTMLVSHPKGDLFDAALYRWEFLRRNPQYRSDYNAFMSRFGAWLERRGRWPHDEPYRVYTKSEQEYFRTKIEPVLIELCRKWQVSDLFPPDFGLEEMKANDEGAWFPPARISRSSPSTRELKKMGFLGMGTITRQYENYLLIQVDLDSPMNDVLEQTRHILRLARKHYKREMEAKGLGLPKSRRRFEDYVLHLRVWDLKKEGKRNTEIARLIFPKLPVHSALSKVRDHLKAANKLISGHYREIG
jgi:hypothetical protein